MEFSDDFNRTDGDLGANWIEVDSGIDVVSNAAQVVGAPSDNLWFEEVSIDDQFAEFEVDTFLGSSRPNLILRSNLGYTQAYVVQFRNANSDVIVYRRHSSGYSVLLDDTNTHTYQPGDILTATVETIGGFPIISAYINGNLQSTYTDTDTVNYILSNGYVGVRGSVDGTRVDNFVGGRIDIVPPTPTPVPPTPTSTPSATLTPSPTASASAGLGLQDEEGFQFLGQIMAFVFGLIGYTVLASTLYKR